MNFISIKPQCGISGVESLGMDYTELTSSLDDIVMPNNIETFIGRAAGDSMEGVGIFDGDLLIVDRAIPIHDGDVVVANLNGEFVCKILDYKNGRLLSASDKYNPVVINECDVFSCEGVVRSSIRLFRSFNGMRSKRL